MTNDELFKLCNALLEDRMYIRSSAYLPELKAIAIALKSRLEREKTHVLAPREPTEDWWDDV